uniref:CRISPR system Cms protein Csm2 n=1 Tax=Thermodesulfobacterium geofontis TaxID=1295609 RepID=A0A7C4NZT1_9BACT
MLKQEDRRDDPIKNLKDVLDNEKTFLKIDLKDLIGPESYAAKISKKLNITPVQLRKVFSEFKNIYALYKANYKNLTEEKKEEIRLKLYKLYPILQYQANRGLIDHNFKTLMWEILNLLDEKISENKKEEFDRVIDFMEALVAYMK